MWRCPITFVPAHHEDTLVQIGEADFTLYVMSSPLDVGQDTHWHHHILLKLCLWVIRKGWRGFREMLIIISIEL